MRVEFHELEKEDIKLDFVVIQARYEGKWIFVQHKERVTWEIPGGHIELGETPDEAAKRELWEESGAIDFDIIPICDYCFIRDEVDSFGRLYFAEIATLGEIPESEIHKRIFGNELPNELTYKPIQPYLYNKVIEYLERDI